MCVCGDGGGAGVDEVDSETKRELNIEMMRWMDTLQRG